MAITTAQQKVAILRFNDWTWAALPISSDGLDAADSKMFVHGYPTQMWSDGTPAAGTYFDWLVRARRKRKR